MPDYASPCLVAGHALEPDTRWVACCMTFNGAARSLTQEGDGDVYEALKAYTHSLQVPYCSCLEKTDHWQGLSEIQALKVVGEDPT